MYLLHPLNVTDWCFCGTCWTTEWRCCCSLCWA